MGLIQDKPGELAPELSLTLTHYIYITLIVLKCLTSTSNLPSQAYQSTPRVSY